MESLYKLHISINQWAEEDRPREKLLLQGRRALSDAELISILIGSGSRNESAVELGRRILKDNGNDLNELATLLVEDLYAYTGIGEAKAVTIIAALELGRRRSETTEVLKKQIGSSKDAFEVLKPQYMDLNHEEFWILLLNQANRVQSKQLISRGGRAGTVVDAKLVFESALRHKATAIILSHNHPSGNLKPSDQDRNLTKKLVEGGKLLDVRVLDHLIFSNNAYYSFSDEGLL
jgi:DNA repair protein RadC